MSTLMWLPIIEATIKYLEALPELENYQVGVQGNTKSPTGTSGRASAENKSIIEIDWDSETNAQDKATKITDLAIYLKIKYRTDDPNLMAAYQEMYRVQNAVLDNIKLLQGFLLQNHRIAVNITSAGVAPMGTTTRPYYANQMVMLFEWRKE